MTTNEIITFAQNNIGRAVVINFFNAEYRWRHYRVEGVNSVKNEIAVTSMTDDEGNQRNGYFTWISATSIMNICLRT